MLRAFPLFFLLLVVPAAYADVTLEEITRTEGAGLMSMANMSIRSTTRIAGDRARTESDMQMKSGVMRMFAGGGPTAEIVRLDQDMVYSLNLKKKRYTQMSLADQRAQMQQAMAQAQEAQQAQQQTTSGVDESKCEWSEPKADVKKTGETAAIAGFSAERVMITASQTCTDPSTGSACEFALMLDQWLARDFPAEKETLAYHRAYAEKLGFDAAGSADFSKRAEQSFGRYQGMWTKVAAQLGDIKGYPVKSSFALAVGGPTCQSAAPSDTTATAQPSATQNVGQAVGGAIGGAIGGLFGRKKPEPAAETPASAPPAAPATIGNGLVPLMTVSSELVSVTQGTVDAAQFEVPAGFKLEK